MGFDPHFTDYAIEQAARRRRRPEVFRIVEEEAERRRRADDDCKHAEQRSVENEMKGSKMFNTGEKLFIRTVTYHQVGEIEAVEDGFLRLKDASWVADSGRFHTALESGNLSEVEYVGTAIVNVGTIVDAFPWNHDLPTESI